jgi:hypothetical protein
VRASSRASVVVLAWVLVQAFVRELRVQAT